jgi:hypothetical protein
MTSTTTYTEDVIRSYVLSYAEYHGVEPDAVDVAREMDGKTVTGFRLSLDVDGRSRGCDEKFGTFGQ